MAPLKAIATWYSGERQASLAGGIMVAGGIGALLSTAPLAAALALLSWRGIFVVLAVPTFASALCIVWVVPDTPLHSPVAGWKDQWAGLQTLPVSAPLC